VVVDGAVVVAAAAIGNAFTAFSPV